MLTLVYMTLTDDLEIQGRTFVENDLSLQDLLL